jgi:hypothetical protein
MRIGGDGGHVLSIRPLPSGRKTMREDSPMSLTVEGTKSIVIAVSVMIIVGLFLYVVQGRSGASKFNIKVGENQLEMDFSGDEITFQNVVGKLLNNEHSRKETLAILNGVYGLYKRDSMDLINSYRIDDNDSELFRSIRQLLIDLSGLFNRKFHSYYDITQISVINGLKELPYDHPVLENLRDLSDKHESIFATVIVPAEIYIDNTLSNRNAKICEGDKYFGRTIAIQNLADPTRVITVSASDTFPCPVRTNHGKLEERKILLRINCAAGRQLFGEITPKTPESVEIYPAPEGYTFPDSQGTLDTSECSRVKKATSQLEEPT